MRELFQQALKRFKNASGDQQAGVLFLLVIVPPIGVLLWALAIYAVVSCGAWLLGMD